MIMKYIKYAISALVLCAALACTKNKTKETLPEIENLVVTASPEISVATVSFQQRYIPGAEISNCTVGVQIFCTEEGTSIAPLTKEWNCLPGIQTYTAGLTPLASETNYKVRAFCKAAEAKDTTFGAFVNIKTAAIAAVVKADTSAVTDISATLKAAVVYANSVALPTKVDFYFAEGKQTAEDLIESGTVIKGTVSGTSASASTLDEEDDDSKLKAVTEYSFIAVATITDDAVKGLADTDKKSITVQSEVFSFTTAATPVEE